MRLFKQLGESFPVSFPVSSRFTATKTVAFVASAAVSCSVLMSPPDLEKRP